MAAVGITNQRASTILWDRRSGEPVGPGVGWQDLRTVGMCLALQAQGLHLAPNASATKLAFLLDLADPDRRRSAAGELAFGTVDTWLAWTLSGGAVHVTDPGNAAVTGLLAGDGSGWDPAVLEALRIPPEVLPAIVDSAGVVGEARAAAGGAPDRRAGRRPAGVAPRAGLRGARRHQADAGDGRHARRLHRPHPPGRRRPGPSGTIPIVAWRRAGVTTWGAEGIAITAGTAVEWIRDGLGLVPDSAASEALAASVADTGGVVFVPALFGLGAPRWDYGARGGFFGMTRGTGRAEMVRAVLEGVAHRGADLLEAGRGRHRPAQSANCGSTAACRPTASSSRPWPTSPAARWPCRPSPRRRRWAPPTWPASPSASGPTRAETAALFRPQRVAEPALGADARSEARARFAAAVEGCAGWVPELSAITF